MQLQKGQLNGGVELALLLAEVSKHLQRMYVARSVHH